MVTATLHAKTLAFKRRVDQAKQCADSALSDATAPVVMWSGGKDSTVLAHLIAVEMGANVPLVSEKDDLDFPGEDAYIYDLATTWGAHLTIVRPPVSLVCWIVENRHLLKAGGDIHSRGAEMSKRFFYPVVEEASSSNELVFLGLRKDESKARLVSRMVHGLTYKKKINRFGVEQTVCNPLGDWSGLDVYAYLQTRNVEPLDIYRCIAFMHAREPWRVRKSWWLPGSSSRQGGVAWLRHYYPALYQQLIEWFPVSAGYS